MITQSELKHLLHYDPETGLWTWLNPPSHNGHLKGKQAGSARLDGYIRIRINGVGYYTHRLAFLYMEGEWPEEEVDHIDRDPSNGKWSNLRHATRSENRFNSAVYNSSTGLRGVHMTPEGKFSAQASTLKLGHFETAQEAAIARDIAIVEMAGPFAILNFPKGDHL